MIRLWTRAKDLVVHRILHLDDTPHRIAWGCCLGMIVMWTPTLGFQIVLYLAIAALLRANKAAGIPLLFISNPFTAVPIYYFAWKVGVFVLHGTVDPSAAASEAIRDQLSNQPESSLWADLFTAEFWEEAWRTIVAMGVELWVGCLVMGLTTGIPVYVLAIYGIRAYRRRRVH